MNVRARALTIKFFQYLVMVVVAIIMFFPILWIIASSFKPLIEFNSYPPSLFPSHLYFKNYTELFLQSKIFIYLRNTLILIIGNTLGLCYRALLWLILWRGWSLKDEILYLGLYWRQ